MTAQTDPFSKWLVDKSPMQKTDPFEKWVKPVQKEEEPSTLKEIPKQFAKESTAGFLGTYGDILDFLGVQPKEQLPGERAQFELESKATPEQLPFLIETDEIAPRYSKLPSSQEVSKTIEALGGPGEAKTTPGKYAARIGRLTGGGPAVGSALLKAPAIAGAVGQSLEQLGAPAWAQAAGELISFVKSAPSVKQVTAKDPKIKNRIDDLRKLGYSEEDLTLAKNALEQRGFLKKTSVITADAENRFKTAFQNTEKNFNEIINKSFPGIENGLGSLEKAGTELYNAVDDIARNVVIEKPDIFVNEATKSINELERVLAKAPQRKQVIELLENAIESSGKAREADYFTEFYKELNSIGNWSNPKQREKVFRITKDAIKKTFEDQGPEGKKLASLFEQANESWRKFRQAEDVKSILDKAITEEGTNFTKLSKAIENTDNFETISNAIGKTQAQNLKLIAKTGSDIKDLKKSIEGGIAKEALKGGKLFSIAKAIATLDLSTLKTAISAEAFGRLSTRLLTDPSYQNLTLRMMDAIKNNKWDQLRILAMNAENKLEKDEINLKDSQAPKTSKFLTTQQK